MASRGSEWRRWEPHIHAPGTILNDQFRGADRWDAYLGAIEGSSPSVEAIAITDYYVTDTYEEVLRRKAAGRLPGVGLIFPNIEVRLDVAAKSGFVNMHLLVSPEDSEHLTEARRILTRLEFSAYGDCFNCTRDELIRLGKRSDTSIQDERAALAHGATQFKVNFSQLREVFGKSDWAKANILIGVAGGASDGTSGLRQAADMTLRQEIEKFAHVIFASSSAQRDFWLGNKSSSVAELRARYDGCKPCLHGSDAHDPATVGRPVDQRYTWIKGAPTFDALRQACIDPGSRAYVGAEPPPTAIPSQVIKHVEITDADWALTPSLPLNPGLVAIIGARGSGKTALADIIAAGCDAITASAWHADENASPSFLVRARPLIGDSAVTLTWGGAGSTSRGLDGHGSSDPFRYPRARYLSQQFVEELCSSKGASEGLVREIERVIFEAHGLDERDGAVGFIELRELRTLRFRQARQREVEAISAISDRIADELEKEGLVPALQSEIAQKRMLVAGYYADLAKLVVRGTEVQARRHTGLSEAAQRQNSKLQILGAQRRTFVALQDEVKSTRAAKAPEMLRQAQARHPGSGLDANRWDDFLLVYKGDVDQALIGYLSWVDRETSKIHGPPLTPGDPDTPLIAVDADLSMVPLATLKAEMTRLEQFISADTVVRNQYVALSSRITAENAAIQSAEARLTDAQGASMRRKTLQAERDDAYGRIFEAINSEQEALAALYEPLVTRLNGSTGTLRKLNFSVSRVVDARGWADFAEENLIDCRRKGPFYGRESLISIAEASLKPVWETGTAAEVQEAMTAFISTYRRDLFVHAPYLPTQQSEFRIWSKRFAHWLFGTNHIGVRYEIGYDGVDIRKLSPGTRGIVLLLLYLALDDADDRPLIIDQPEENLDPKSVFERTR